MGISFTVPECPTYFLNNLNINLNNLSRDDESSQACPDNTDISKTIQTQCATNKWDYCSFNLSTIISDTSCLYLDKDLNIEYTCGGNGMFTFYLHLNYSAFQSFKGTFDII